MKTLKLFGFFYLTSIISATAMEVVTAHEEHDIFIIFFADIRQVRFTDKSLPVVFAKHIPSGKRFSAHVNESSNQVEAEWVIPGNRQKLDPIKSRGILQNNIRCRPA